MKKYPEVSIIVPVYADWESLRECIKSLKTYIDKRHRVLFVNDSGPEADVLEKKIKDKITENENFFYFRNKTNLGFVRNCNNAVKSIDKTDNDILLLNSDAKVTENFLEEMQKVLYSSEKIATVSPRSNNATITTVPLSSASHKGIDPYASYKLFQTLKTKLPQHDVVPTAHGFCMLIRRALIREYGLFDEVFGRGYGEEVDLCQRLAQQGYKSTIANRAFVFHMEARSFTLETKAELLEKNNKIIWERYPHYRESVREYMTQAIDRENRLLNGMDIVKLRIKPLIKKYKSGIMRRIRKS